MDWLEVFHSSGYPRRAVELGHIDEWVDSGFISMTRIVISDSPRIRLYLALEERLARFRKINVADLKSDDFKMIEHLRSTASRLLGYGGRVGGG